mgnify:CR=1 FL=1
MKKDRIVIWHEGRIKRGDRERLLGQKGVVIWFTGLPSSGKSTLAHALEEKLYELGHVAYVLDGDNIRHGLNEDLGFSPEDREENIRRIGEVARLFADAGIIAITAFISPYRRDRRRARSLLEEGRFIEVYCKCSLKVCEERDPKGLYKKARAGEVKEFTGISAPYEEPEKPEIVIKTDKYSVEKSIKIILKYLIDHKIILEKELFKLRAEQAKKVLEELGYL